MRHLIILFIFVFSFKFGVSQTNYIDVIDKSTTSLEYKSLTTSIGERPIVIDPDYNGWRYYSFYNSGIEILVKNGKVHTIFFHNKKNLKFNSFSGKLPKALTWGMTKSQVRSKLGYPSKQGGGGEFLGEPVLYWDKYVYSTYALHTTYKSSKVYEVCIMSLKP